MYLHDSEMQLIGPCLSNNFDQVCIPYASLILTVKLKCKTCVPLASVQLELSTTYTSQNDQDTKYATIPMM